MTQLLNPIRCWFYCVKLNLIQSEIYDTLDDMSQALSDSNFGVYRALAEFHTELVTEAVRLKARIRSLTT